MANQNIQYEEDGHRHTTFVVARLAGISVGDALVLSWGSQIPDANRKFEAISAAWKVLWSRHSRRLMRVLHSLHGGEEDKVLKRRLDLKRLIFDATVTGRPMWEIGLYVHAYGDSYAHTYHTRDGKLQAYGIPHGHFFDGHKPDEIGLFVDKYIDYTNNLYQSLGGKANTKAALNELHTIVLDLDGGRNDYVTQIYEYSKKLGMDEEESNRVGRQLLEDISVSDIVRAMDSMEASFKD